MRLRPYRPSRALLCCTVLSHRRSCSQRIPKSEHLVTANWPSGSTRAPRAPVCAKNPGKPMPTIESRIFRHPRPRRRSRCPVPVELFPVLMIWSEVLFVSDELARRRPLSPALQELPRLFSELRQLVPGLQPGRHRCLPGRRPPQSVIQGPDQPDMAPGTERR